MTNTTSLIASRLKATCLKSAVFAITLSAAAVATAGAAQAQADEGFYGTLRGGAVIPSDINYASGVNANLNLDPKTGWTLGGAYGYRFGNGVRTELSVDYLHANLDGTYRENLFTIPCGTVAGQPCLGPNVDGGLKSWSGFAMAYYDLDVGNNLHPYVGGGLGVLRTSLDVETTARTNAGATSDFDIIDDHDSEFAYRLAAGVAYDISPTTKFDVGYTFTRSGRYAMDGRGSALPAFNFDGRTKTHAVTAGLRFAF